MSGTITEQTAFRVAAFEPDRTLLWAKPDSTRAWLLVPLDGERTRVQTTSCRPPETTKGSHVTVEALVVASDIGAGNRIRTGDPQLGNGLHAQSTWCHRFARAGNDWRWL
jgi:hypothetical protein